jgi:hypothetical protein
MSDLFTICLWICVIFVTIIYLLMCINYTSEVIAARTKDTETVSTGRKVFYFIISLFFVFGLLCNSTAELITRKLKIK